MKNRSLADSQRKEVQIENMRIVTVNAQVTAMISIAEIIGFLIITIISVIAKTSIVGEILFPLLQNIILPYAFLMNTRENKHRIVEKGWKNVLRNTINNLFPTFTRSSNVVTLNQIESTRKEKVYTISRQLNAGNESTGHLENTINSRCNLNMPSEEVPCTSANKESDLKRSDVPPIKRVDSDSTIESLNHEKQFLDRRREFINELMHDKAEETNYVYTFTRFVSHEQQKSDTDDDIDSKMVEDETIQKVVQKLLSKGGCSSRAILRKDMIQRLLEVQQEEEQFQLVFDEFLNMEENFLEEEM